MCVKSQYTSSRTEFKTFIKSYNICFITYKWLTEITDSIYIKFGVFMYG